MTALVLRREAFEHGLLPVHQLLPAVETLALVQVRDVSPLPSLRSPAPTQYIQQLQGDVSRPVTPTPLCETRPGGLRCPQRRARQARASRTAHYSRADVDCVVYQPRVVVPWLGRSCISRHGSSLTLPLPTCPHPRTSRVYNAVSVVHGACPVRVAPAAPRGERPLRAGPKHGGAEGCG
jgi:hypothetical protein